MYQSPIGTHATPVAATPVRFYRQRIKRCFDLMLCALALPIALPLIAIAVVIVLRGGGTPFFGHMRVGRGGRLFRCWKLRTMVPDADKVLVDHLKKDEAAAAEYALRHKLSNDPRITPAGRVLRRYSVDELPQLWNVVKGEMSLVGPRPITVGELDAYGPNEALYTSVRPGITGLWQVSGRNGLTFPERIAFDSRYGREVSFALDFKILVRTVAVVLRGSG